MDVTLREDGGLASVCPVQRLMRAAHLPHQTPGLMSRILKQEAMVPTERADILQDHAGRFTDRLFQLVSSLIPRR